MKPVFLFLCLIVYSISFDPLEQEQQEPIIPQVSEWQQARTLGSNTVIHTIGSDYVTPHSLLPTEVKPRLVGEYQGSMVPEPIPPPIPCPDCSIAKDADLPEGYARPSGWHASGLVTPNGDRDYTVKGSSDLPEGVVRPKGVSKITPKVEKKADTDLPDGLSRPRLLSKSSNEVKGELDGDLPDGIVRPRKADKVTSEEHTIFKTP